MVDRTRRNRLPTGEGHTNAKLTDRQVAEIRQRFVNGEGQTFLSRAFGVSQTQISNIVHGYQRGGIAVAAPPRNLDRYVVICEQCGESFHRKPGQRPPRFCSKPCQSLAQRRGTPRTCPVCGTEFYRPPSAKGDTCSYRCMGLRQTAEGSVRGERNGNAKLTDAQRDEIRTRRAGGERVIDLATWYGVSRDQIARITNAGT